MKFNLLKPIALFILLIILFACEKEENELQPVVIDDEVVIGKYTNVDVTYYDTTLIGYYYNPINLLLDLDSDGEDDLNLISGVYGSPAVGQIPEVKLECLHDEVKLLGQITYDTLWFYKSSYIYSNEPVEVIVSNNYSCEQISENDKVYKTSEVFEIIPLLQGDPIFESDYFQADTLILSKGTLNMPPAVETSNDTTYYIYQTYYNNCSDFPLDQIVYVGFKFEDSDKLGWFKIGIYSTYKLVILESAIQK